MTGMSLLLKPTGRMRRLTELHLESVLVPYIKQQRRELSFAEDHPALVIFDRFKGQCTSNILSIVDIHNICLVIVPANCTDRLQPLDVSVNNAVKENLRSQFQDWYATQVSKRIGGKTELVDLSMAVIKPRGATWLMNTVNYMYIKANPSIIINGFRGAGII